METRRDAPASELLARTRLSIRARASSLDEHGSRQQICTDDHLRLARVQPNRARHLALQAGDGLGRGERRGREDEERDEDED